MSALPLEIPDVRGLSVPAAARVFAAANIRLLRAYPTQRRPVTFEQDNWRWKGLSSCDPVVVAEWWPPEGRMAACIDLGACGWVVIDLDRPGMLVEPLLSVLRESGAPFQSTNPGIPGKGHYVFRQPQGRLLGNKTAIGKGQDVMAGAGDIRGAGGVIRTFGKHPDADDGARYEWERWGPVPELPLSISSLLPDKGEDSEPADTDQVKDFLERHDTQDDPMDSSIEVLVWNFHNAVRLGRGRHTSAAKWVKYAMIGAAKGRFPAREALAEMHKAWHASLARPPLSGQKIRSDPRDVEWRGIVKLTVGSTIKQEEEGTLY